MCLRCIMSCIPTISTLSVWISEVLLHLYGLVDEVLLLFYITACFLNACLLCAAKTIVIVQCLLLLKVMHDKGVLKVWNLADYYWKNGWIVFHFVWCLQTLNDVVKKCLVLLIVSFLFYLFLWCNNCLKYKFVFV